VETEEAKHPTNPADFQPPPAQGNARRTITANHLTMKEGMIEGLPYF